jgi:hypothetical protein
MIELDDGSLSHPVHRREGKSSPRDLFEDRTKLHVRFYVIEIFHVKLFFNQEEFFTELI